MSQIPHTIAHEWEEARHQIEDLFRELYEDRVGGLKTSTSLVKYKDELRLDTGSANAHLLTNANADGHSWSTPYKTTTFTRDMQAASGNVSYTGIGFKPSAILFLFSHSTNVSMGACYGSTNYHIGSWGTTPSYYYNSSFCFSGVEAVDKKQEAALSSFDSDGFTLTWTKTGTTSSGTATIYAIAFR